jgi:hypothetical protein
VALAPLEELLKVGDFLAHICDLENHISDVMAHMGHVKHHIENDTAQQNPRESQFARKEFGWITESDILNVQKIWNQYGRQSGFSQQS